MRNEINPDLLLKDRHEWREVMVELAQQQQKLFNSPGSACETRNKLQYSDTNPKVLKAACTRVISINLEIFTCKLIGYVCAVLLSINRA